MLDVDGRPPLTLWDHALTEEPMTSWAQGYLAAARQYGHGIDYCCRDEATITVERWWDRWCAAHPNELLESATKALVDEFDNERRELGPPIRVPPSLLPLPAITKPALPADKVEFGHSDSTEHGSMFGHPDLVKRSVRSGRPPATEQ